MSALISAIALVFSAVVGLVGVLTNRDVTDGYLLSILIMLLAIRFAIKERP